MTNEYPVVESIALDKKYCLIFKILQVCSKIKGVKRSDTIDFQSRG